MQATTLPTCPTIETDQIPEPSGAGVAVQEASSLGWPPGEFPDRFEYTTHDGWTSTYRRIAPVRRGATLVAFRYRSTLISTPEIHILND